MPKHKKDANKKRVDLEVVGPPVSGKESLGSSTVGRKKGWVVRSKGWKEKRKKPVC